MLTQLALFLVSDEIKLSLVESLLQDGFQVQSPDIAVFAKGFDKCDFKFCEIIETFDWRESLDFGDGFSTESEAFFGMDVSFEGMVIFGFVVSIKKPVYLSFIHKIDNALPTRMQMFQLTDVIDDIVEGDIIGNEDLGFGVDQRDFLRELRELEFGLRDLLFKVDHSIFDSEQKL